MATVTRPTATTVQVTLTTDEGDLLTELEVENPDFFKQLIEAAFAKKRMRRTDRRREDVGRKYETLPPADQAAVDAIINRTRGG